MPKVAWLSSEALPNASLRSAPIRVALGWSARVRGTLK